MDASEPRARHRGYFLHSETTGEPDTGEHENPEGLIVRVRIGPQTSSGARRAIAAARLSTGRSRVPPGSDESRPEIRSGSVTGSRQRADWRR
jgi:hypothetical protein